MKCVSIFILILVILARIACDEESCARKYINYVNERIQELRSKVSEVKFGYYTNITEENSKQLLKLETTVAKEQKEHWEVITSFNWRNFKDEELKRQCRLYSIIGTKALPAEKFEKLNKATLHMATAYSTAKLCSFKNKTKCDLPLEPDVFNILKTSRNASELEYYWVEWRKAVGPNLKSSFLDYVTLMNEGAQLNNLSDAGEMWLEDFENKNIKDSFAKIWEQLKPLYLQVHAYVRFKLRKSYGSLVSEKGPIPVHLFGNMWAQNWAPISDIVLPYPNEPNPDITPELVKQNYNAMKIFKTAEDFYVSIGLFPMTDIFWNKSVIEKPTDREIICHASAWDMNKKDDYRIKMCTRINENSFFTVHHEMGHVEYYMAYREQPFIYRRGANSGFHEAIGDTVALSVKSQKHLFNIKLIPKDSLCLPTVINSQMIGFLAETIFLPFGYLVDLWRWDVFSEKVKPENYNCHWWKLILDYQGLEPPVDRSESDFDPISKYHVGQNYPYISYYVSRILEFQFYRALCIRAKQYDPKDPNKPLYNCDFYKNKEAGQLFKDMLTLGRSKPWPDALEVITRQREMDGSAIVEYFEPLMNWVKKENKKNGVFVGWEAPKRTCKSHTLICKTSV